MSHIGRLGGVHENLAVWADGDALGLDADRLWVKYRVNPEDEKLRFPSQRQLSLSISRIRVKAPTLL